MIYLDNIRVLQNVGYIFRKNKTSILSVFPIGNVLHAL